jgi:hypothetical protein
MSKKKVFDVKVLPEYVNTYIPNKSGGYTKAIAYRIWVQLNDETWVTHPKTHANRAYMAKFEIAVRQKGWIKLDEWYYHTCVAQEEAA